MSSGWTPGTNRLSSGLIRRSFRSPTQAGMVTIIGAQCAESLCSGTSATREAAPTMSIASSSYSMTSLQILVFGGTLVPMLGPMPIALQFMLKSFSQAWTKWQHSCAHGHPQQGLSPWLRPRTRPPHGLYLRCQNAAMLKQRPHQVPPQQKPHRLPPQ